ncbi:MAG: EF-hand domain-containing protein [Pseudomonadota bacterium]
MTVSQSARHLGLALCLLLPALCTLAAGLEGAGAQAGVSQADPYVPPAQRHVSREAPTAGAALQGQALQKLKLHFDGADQDADGHLTRAEASAAGLGFVLRHFEQIDASHRGKISFEELQQFMAAQRKARPAP